MHAGAAIAMARARSDGGSLTRTARRVDNPRVTRGSIAVTLARTAALAAFAALGALAACRGGASADATAPPCSAVAARFLDLAKYDLGRAKVDDATARGVNDQLPAMRDALAQACANGRWSAAIRTCLVQAGDHVAFETCERELTDEQRRDLGRAGRESPGTSP
jgi:hypothetical protein